MLADTCVGSLLQIKSDHKGHFQIGIIEEPVNRGVVVIEIVLYQHSLFFLSTGLHVKGEDKTETSMKEKGKVSKYLRNCTHSSQE